MSTKLILRLALALLVCVAAGYALSGCSVATDEAEQTALCSHCGAVPGSAECQGNCAPEAPRCPACRAAGGTCAACAAR